MAVEGYKQKAVRVFAPASVANVAVGFDCLGFALEAPGDEIIARFGSEPGLRITKLGGPFKPKPPRDPEKNTAGYGALKLLEHLGKSDLPIELELFKKMPSGSGLGSSAASAAAGVMAVNELLDRPLSKEELVPFAMMGESIASGALHGDNVIPALLGGIVLIRDNENGHFIKLPVPRGLLAFVIRPDIEILTKDARAVLSETVSLKDHVAQSGHLGTFVAGLYLSNFELMSDSLKDIIVEPQRAGLLPDFYMLQQLALEAGALNFSISGAGPSMFGLCQNNLSAENAIAAISQHLDQMGITSSSYISKVNTVGAIKM